MSGEKGTTIWLTKHEYALLNEGRELFCGFTGLKKISWGAYLSALSIGALAAKAITGLTIRCPNCENEVEMTLVNPRRRQSEVRQLPKQKQPQ